MYFVRVSNIAVEPSGNQEQDNFASQFKQLVRNDSNLVMSPLPMLRLLAQESLVESFEDVIKRQQEAVRFFSAIGGKEKFDAIADPFFDFLRPRVMTSIKYNKCTTCRSNQGKIGC